MAKEKGPSGPLGPNLFEKRLCLVRKLLGMASRMPFADFMPTEEIPVQAKHQTEPGEMETSSCSRQGQQPDLGSEAKDQGQLFSN